MRTLSYKYNKVPEEMETNDCAQKSSEITLDKFASLVRDMRHAQRRYFATRDKNVLQTSKKLEHDVDAIIERIFDRQQYFF